MQIGIKAMCFFKKDKSKHLENKPNEVYQLEPPVIQNVVDYDSVLNYLVGLGRRDYDKIFKVADIYRKANDDAAKVLGVKNEPITAIKETEAPVPDSETAQDDELDLLMDDVLPADFIEAEPKNIEVKEK